MGKDSAIEWTDHTWNPWMGCTKISPGCQNCYMFRERERWGQNPSIVTRTKDKTFNSSLKWKEPATIFVCSWSDFFHIEADEWRDEAWDIMRDTPHHTYLILTKRPALMEDRLPSDWDSEWDKIYSHIWLGVSVENNDYRFRIDVLRATRCTVRFVSAEPLLGPLNLLWYLGTPAIQKSGWPLVNWVIAGGESGPSFRRAELDWFRDLRDQCRDTNVPFFLKQLGGKVKVDGTWGGRMLDGQTHDAMPERRNEL